MKKLYALFLFVILLVACTPKDLPPNPGIPSVNVFGKATGVFEGYSEPTSFSLSQEELSFTVEDIEKSITAEVTQEQYVYRYGFVLNAGTNEWERFSFDQPTAGLSNWIRGTASTELTISLDSLSISSGEMRDLYAIAYACSKIDNVWNCHENKWMIKNFKAMLESSAGEEIVQTTVPDTAPAVDSDGDMIEDSIDTDDDNDNVLDEVDAFPTDSSESLDTDNDGTGNNTDDDDDGDGVLDVNDAFPFDKLEALDTDNDGIGNDADADDDGDMVPDLGDAFTLDPTESVDTDGDGIGNNADSDDDGDEIPDSSDAFPLVADENTDTDNDGIGNNADPDDDNDNVPDTTDAFPTNPNESVDTDNDGTGNNTDDDDDNDGALDSDDAFPLNPNEVLDTDNDNIGNNADINDDNDSALDSSDAFPLNSAETLDTDSDMMGNNADPDDDGDGVLDSDDAFPLDSTKWCAPITSCSAQSKTCGTVNDGCAIVSCGTCNSGYVCSSGSCVLACSDECSINGAKQCSGSAAFQTCGNYDPDACLEWSSVTSCPGGYACGSGNCYLTPPPTPTGLIATKVSSSQINLVWSVSPGATFYKVYRATSGAPTELYASGITTLSYLDYGAVPISGTRHCYHVTAVNSAGESPKQGISSCATI